jgi:hypothetical protein
MFDAVVRNTTRSLPPTKPWKTGKPLLPLVPAALGDASVVVSVVRSRT